MFDPHDLWMHLRTVPLFWLAATIASYHAALALYRRSGRHPLVNPVLVSVTLIISLLLLTDTPYDMYFNGAQIVHFLIGPATVAMAIPLYAQTERLKTMLVPLIGALFVGSVTAIASAVALGWVFGASSETLLSLAPKSTTMPIAMGIAEKIGGVPSLTSLTVTVTGISGAVMARGLLNLIRIDDPAVRGFAIGTTAHAIGTGYALQVSEVAGAFSALGMGLNGVTTAVLLPLLMQIVSGHR